MRCLGFSRASALAAGCALISLGALSLRAQSANVADSRSHPVNPSPMDATQKESGTPSICSAAPNSDGASLSYVIGPGDVLAITVWKDSELSRTMPVRPDGRISMPVLGDLQASGLTASQLQSKICERLGDYIRSPQVNVIVSEIKSRTFNVVGRVQKAGSFELIRPTTVLDAIAAAGGFQEFARQSKIYVLRNEPDNPTLMFPFNYKQVIKGRRSDENVQLRPGDTVVVP